MKKSEITVLIEGFRKLSADAAAIAALLTDSLPPSKTQETPAEEEMPKMVYSKEEVRAILADRSRSGFRAEVKALLTAHGAKQLSDITDPEELAALAAEAEVIGNG